MMMSFKGATPQFGADVFVAENATVIGDVILGDDASIWFGSVLRGDIAPIRVGCRTNIQDLSVVHVARSSRSMMSVGDDVTVGHSVILHACAIGNACLIGMGSAILDDAVIGDHSIVGAGSLVTRGKEFPPRSMIIGSPAKLVRSLSDEEVNAIYDSSRIYVELKAHYKQ